MDIECSNIISIKRMVNEFSNRKSCIYVITTDSPHGEVITYIRYMPNRPTYCDSRYRSVRLSMPCEIKTRFNINCLKVVEKIGYLLRGKRWKLLK